MASAIQAQLNLPAILGGGNTAAVATTATPDIFTVTFGGGLAGATIAPLTTFTRCPPARPPLPPITASAARARRHHHASRQRLRHRRTGQQRRGRQYRDSPDQRRRHLDAPDDVPRQSHQRQQHASQSGARLRLRPPRRRGQRHSRQCHLDRHRCAGVQAINSTTGDQFTIVTATGTISGQLNGNNGLSPNCAAGGRFGGLHRRPEVPHQVQREQRRAHARAGDFDLVQCRAVAEQSFGVRPGRDVHGHRGAGAGATFASATATVTFTIVSSNGTFTPINQAVPLSGIVVYTPPANFPSLLLIPNSTFTVNANFNNTGIFQSNVARRLANRESEHGGHQRLVLGAGDRLGAERGAPLSAPRAAPLVV